MPSLHSQNAKSVGSTHIPRVFKTDTRRSVKLTNLNETEFSVLVRLVSLRRIKYACNQEG